MQGAAAIIVQMSMASIAATGTLQTWSLREGRELESQRHSAPQVSTFKATLSH